MDNDKDRMKNSLVGII